MIHAPLGTALLVGLWCFPAGVEAQSPTRGPRIPVHWIAWAPPVPSASLPTRRRHAALSRAEEGALVGALALGTTAAVIRASMCKRGESCIGPTIGWGLMGATVGAVVGGLILGAGE